MKHHTLRRLAAPTAALIVGSALAVGLAQTAPQTAAPQGTVVIKGLNGPQGVLVAPDGSVWAVDSGTGGPTVVNLKDARSGQPAVYRLGDTARVVKLAADGTQSDVATLPSFLSPDGEASGGSRLALIGNTVYVTSGDWTANREAQLKTRFPRTAAVLKLGAGGATELGNTWDFEKANNPDGTQLESHPYGLAAGPDGQLWVADAAGNALVKLDPATGKESLVTAFAGLTFAAGAPVPPMFAQGNPARGGKVEIDPVPTGLVVEADGSAYVSYLAGFPWPAGQSRVVKVSKAGAVSDFATSPEFTMLTDVRRGPDGNLYAVNFAVPAAIPGQYLPNSGSVYRIDASGKSVKVLGGLSFPTSVDFNKAGDAYVALNGVGAPGSGNVTMFKAIAVK